jgi:hypothetical protein
MSLSRRTVTCANCKSEFTRWSHLQDHYKVVHPGLKCIEKGQSSLDTLFGKSKRLDDEKSEPELEKLSDTPKKDTKMPKKSCEIPSFCMRFSGQLWSG